MLVHGCSASRRLSSVLPAVKLGFVLQVHRLQQSFSHRRLLSST